MIRFLQLFKDGFELEIDENHENWKMYSEDPNFYNCLFTFASADGAGSDYAFWINNNQTNLDEAPIVIAGGEGGLHVVAENIKELLKILAYDVEASVDHYGVNYYKDDYADYDGRRIFKCRHIYLQWLKEQFNYTHFEDLNETVINEILIKAQDKYQKQFQEWIEKFYQE